MPKQPLLPACSVCSHAVHDRGRCRTAQIEAGVIGTIVRCKCGQSPDDGTGTVVRGPAAKWRVTKEQWERSNGERAGSMLFCRVCLYYLPGSYYYDESCFEDYVHDECRTFPLHPRMMEALNQMQRARAERSDAEA